jgi:HK97 family phage portal protein
MSIFSRIFGDRTPIVVNGSDEYIKQRVLLAAEANTYNISPMLNAAVFTCVKTLSNTIARMPLEVYKDDGNGGKIKAKDHILYKLLHYAPNNYMTSFNLFNTAEANRNIWGNSFIKINYNGKGLIDNLEIIPTEKVVSYKKLNGELWYGVKKSDAPDDVEAVSSSKIIHLKGIAMGDGLWGLNPIDALKIHLSTNYKGLKTIDKWLENNAQVGKIVKMTEVAGLTPDKLKDLLKVWKETLATPENAGNTWIAPPFSDVITSSLDLASAEFLSTLKFNTNTVASLFGVPPHYVGNYEASKFNNVEQLQALFKIGSIAEIAKMYRTELEFKLLSYEDKLNGYSIEFNIDSLVEADYKTKWEIYNLSVMNGVRNPNQIARLEGLPTYPDGENYYVSNNHTLVKAKIKEANGIAPAEPIAE